MTLIEVFGDSRGVDKCRGCSAYITWAVIVKTGRRMPFNGRPAAVQTYERDGRTVEQWDLDANHWATCPGADLFRKRRRTS